MSTSAATVADLKAIPDFAAVDDDVVQTHLDDGASFMGTPAPGGWGSLYSLAHKYIAAHLLATDGIGTGAGSGAGGGRGPVTMERVGPVARSYADPFRASAYKAASALDSTKWGRLYRELARKRGTRVAVAP